MNKHRCILTKFRCYFFIFLFTGTFVLKLFVFSVKRTFYFIFLINRVLIKPVTTLWFQTATHWEKKRLFCLFLCLFASQREVVH